MKQLEKKLLEILDSHGVDEFHFSGPLKIDNYLVSVILVSGVDSSSTKFIRTKIAIRDLSISGNSAPFGDLAVQANPSDYIVPTDLRTKILKAIENTLARYSGSFIESLPKCIV
jgi:predicted PP-loop superfamily ATPase